MVDGITTDSSVVKGKLFSAGQVFLATLVGMPIAGCLLLAENYRQIERNTAAWQSLTAGIISTAVLVIISFWLPENFPNMALPAGYCFAMRQLVIYLQGDAIDNHLKSGASKGSWAIAVAVGLFCLITILAIVFGLITALGD